ncbi:MAG TPA: NAD+ synthase [Gemmatimonadota bacterium]|nr:NAD+ synthase [Gemmatimonadota bacterium]
MAGRSDPGRNGAPPVLDSEFTADALGVFLRQVLADAGRTTFVVGLSGGLDSAVAAAVAARAVGPDAVRAFHLPVAITPPECAPLAGGVADALGISLETVDIAPLAAAAPVPDDPLRRGNLASRLRMAVLYDRAAEAGALVLGTSNKTEIVLGYTTLWGDAAADCRPLGDLYKTQVSAMGRALGLPAAVLERTPSAELWPGQTDEDEMGISYSVADAVLYYYLDLRWRPAEIARAGFDPAAVDRVLSRVRAQSHKRTAPPIPKLGTRTVGLDFLHPRAWRGPA